MDKSRVDTDRDSPLITSFLGNLDGPHHTLDIDTDRSRADTYLLTSCLID